MLDGLMVRKEQVVWGTIPMITATKARTRAALEQLFWDAWMCAEKEKDQMNKLLLMYAKQPAL